MAYEIREGQGTIFPRKGAKKNDKWPDHEGSFRLNGDLYKIALWNTVAKSGVKYWFLKVEPAEEMGPSEERKPLPPF
jgi:hypothetical protein